MGVLWRSPAAPVDGPVRLGMSTRSCDANVLVLDLRVHVLKHGTYSNKVFPFFPHSKALRDIHHRKPLPLASLSSQSLFVSEISDRALMKFSPTRKGSVDLDCYACCPYVIQAGFSCMDAYHSWSCIFISAL